MKVNLENEQDESDSSRDSSERMNGDAESSRLRVDVQSYRDVSQRFTNIKDCNYTLPRHRTNFDFAFLALSKQYSPHGMLRPK